MSQTIDARADFERYRTRTYMPELDGIRAVCVLGVISAHMAEYAQEHASDPRVVALATRIANNQRAELAEYRMAADRIGVTLGGG